jgi:hypothetical protein
MRNTPLVFERLGTVRMRLKSLQNVSDRSKVLLDDGQNLLRGKSRCRFVWSSASIAGARVMTARH